MKLVICPPLQYPAINGTTVYAEQLRDYFDGEVLSTNALDWIAFHSEKGKTHKKGFPIRHLPSLRDSATLSAMKKETSGLLNAYVNGPVSPGLLKALIQSNADVIYSLTLPFLNNYYAYWASKLSGAKSMITPFYIKGFTPLHKSLLRKFDLIFACTNYEKKSLGLQNVEISPMCVDPLPFQKADSRRFREKYGISGKIVLFVGHANYEKGAYSLLKAAEKVKATFVFMGPHTSGFKKQAGKHGNVKLINPQLRNKYDAFAACDVYAMPSRVEAFGITYLEAWACSKPVVAADTPVSREVIGEDGILVKFGENPASAIIDAFERKDLGRKGNEKLLKKFTKKKVMKNLQRFL